MLLGLLDTATTQAPGPSVTPFLALLLRFLRKGKPQPPGFLQRLSFLNSVSDDAVPTGLYSVSQRPQASMEPPGCRDVCDGEGVCDDS